MSAETLLLGGLDGRDGLGAPGSPRLARRMLAAAAALGLALALAGDRGQAATVPAAIYGQDPLEVLSLSVRPNVIVVLDSSGSMKWGVQAPASPPAGVFYPPTAGDHPRSKLWQAKQVLKQIIQDNQGKASFLMAQYDQGTGADVRMQNRRQSTLLDGAVNRFIYSTYACSGACPGAVNANMTNGTKNNGLLQSSSMQSTELAVFGAVGDDFSVATQARGLQSWQLIYGAWNTLYFGESNGANCSATLPGPFPKFYARGATLATDLQNAMNSASCSSASRQNTYSVTYATASGQFTFSTAGPNNFELRNWETPNNIARALGNLNASWTTSSQSEPPYTLLYRHVGPATVYPDYGGGFSGIAFKNNETVASTSVTVYSAMAARFFNGEVLNVNASGEVCNMTFPSAAQRTNPPTFTLQLVDGAAGTCGAPVAGGTATFRWGGGYYVDQGSGSYCDGMIERVKLVPCDLQSPPASTQSATTSPWLDNEFPLDATGMPHPSPTDTLTGAAATAYTERQNGAWRTDSYPEFMAGGMKGYGATPVAASLADIKVLFGTDNASGLWGAGQTGATGMAGPPPYELSPIKDHKSPKEKTIVLFVTDGADTCAGSGDYAALVAADSAKSLFLPVVNQCADAGDSMNTTPPCKDLDKDGVSGFKEPASSVQTYMIGYGDGVNSPADINRLNWMAWGGSGVNVDFTGSDTGNNTTTNSNLKAIRDTCPTCQDAFIAPDASTLARTLQGIIDQGASEGEFSSSQSITETSVFEYVDRAATATCSKDSSISCSSDTVCIAANKGTCNLFDARIPATRYNALAPTRFISSFKLPGFQGQFKAYQYDASQPGNVRTAWSAGEKLWDLVSTAVGTCNDGLAGECSFNSLTAKIGRRIYTTSRNGRFTFTAANLASGTFSPPERVDLWPPASNVASTGTNYTAQGILDQALGLPTDAQLTAAAAPGIFATLQTQFLACTNWVTTSPNDTRYCGDSDPVLRAKAARREAREMILAFMAGAQPLLSGSGVQRSGLAILYQARGSVLADAELATPAVVTQPLQGTPDATPYVSEYKLFTEGVRNGLGVNPGNALEIQQGFGLTNPDKDASAPKGPAPGNTPLPDTRTALKPVMSVVYAPGNDMLHAFRAGPNVSPSSVCTVTDRTTMNATRECGGEELWGFVPFDMLDALRLRVIHDPQGRDNHVFMLTRGIRFADVFVPASSPPITVSIAGVSTKLQGVWRRVLYFGRGIGGKYLTALDVTGPGPYTSTRLSTQGPIPLWSRGNPDTQDGLAGGTNNNTATDRVAYAGMGETWSLPAVAWVDAPIYGTGKHVVFAGSGYGSSVAEGTTFYTLDAVTGNVIASADVGQRGGMAYLNALPANPAGFNPKAFSPLTPKHPSAEKVTRVYIGDVHGRLWKFLTASPNTAIPVADLGADQPVATAAGLLGMPFYPDTPKPFVYATSGADRRGNGPFKIFGFRDDGTDTDTNTTGSTVVNGVTTYTPVEALFQRTFDQGTPEVDCGYSEEAVFRGNVQPATTYECTGGVTAQGACTAPAGRVFFAGNRQSPPNTKFTAPTPLACSNQGEYPCRSQFDSIIYALGAKTGQAAYDLNASGDDAYRIFRDSRIAAIQMVADPDPTRGGSSFRADESLMKGTPQPPPPAGVPPTVSSQTKNVVMARQANKPPPAVRYGSTVCQ